jgi:hypothetical protein
VTDDSQREGISHSTGSRVVGWLVFPLRLALEIFVILFDLILSRYLIAAAVVALIWIPFYLIASIHYKYWLWPTLILGCGLTGLWDGCKVLTIRQYFGKWLLLSTGDRS